MRDVKDRIRGNCTLRAFACAAIMTAVTACDERIHSTYASYAEAERSGLVKRGWVPQFVPESASDISDTHDLDTGAQIFEFSAPERALRSMDRLGAAVTPADAQAAQTLISAHGFSPGALVRIICAEPRDGALLIDFRSGRAAYNTEIRWADDDCS